MRSLEDAIRTAAARAGAPAIAVLLLAGCSFGGGGPAAPAPLAPDAFFDALRAECGKAYAGRVLVDTPTSTPDPFGGKALVMQVRECTDAELRIPFHVGDDRSRTWIVTRTTSGIRLKHDHRHADGSPDALTMYGGDTVDVGTATRQSFPVDAFSIDLFQREDRAVSITNTWALEIESGRTFVYELSRPGGRLFRVAFDLTTPVAPPPPPWGKAPLR